MLDFDYIRILSILPDKMKIWFEPCEYNGSMTLWFSDTIVKIIQNSWETPLLIRCSSFSIFTYYFKIFKKICVCDSDIKLNDSTQKFLHLKDVDRIEFENFTKIADPEEIKKFEDSYKLNPSNIKQKIEIIVPLENLTFVSLNEGINYLERMSLYSKDFIASLNHSLVFKWNINLNKDWKLIEKWVHIFPMHCELN